MLTTLIPIIIVAVLVIAVIGIVSTGYLKAPPDTAFIISGLKKEPRILIGKAGVKIPFIERKDEISLQLIPIDVKTSSPVPTADYININVDAAVNVKVSDEPSRLSLAAQNFLNKNTDYIAHVAREVLEGNMREIVGQMKLEEMVSDRQKFAEMVKTNAAPDLAEMGLDIVSFNVQNFVDKEHVIENLGVDNVVKISKNAAISRATAEKEIAVAQAVAEKEANDANVTAAYQIAEKNAELAQKKADLQKKVDTEQARADAAKDIEAENQRKLRDVAATDANIAKAEREAELKQKQIELKEYELDALVRKQADADKYAKAQEAEADLIRRQKDAEAKAYEIKQAAEAQKAKAAADLFAAEQQAAGIKAVGEAEALAIEKRAEAQKKMGEASVLEMYIDKLPQIVASAAGPLEKVDKITMYGEGNQAKLVQDIMRTADQVLNGVAETTGINLGDLIAGFAKKKLDD